MPKPLRQRQRYLLNYSNRQKSVHILLNTRLNGSLTSERHRFGRIFRAICQMCIFVHGEMHQKAKLSYN